MIAVESVCVHCEKPIYRHGRGHWYHLKNGLRNCCDIGGERMMSVAEPVPVVAPEPDTREAMEHRIADTLAYYECRRNNPKADHPRMGYHAFSEDQRDSLREGWSEAAQEVTRIVFEVRGCCGEGDSRGRGTDSP